MSRRIEDLRARDNGEVWNLNYRQAQTGNIPNRVTSRQSEHSEVRADIQVSRIRIENDRGERNVR